MNPDSSGDDAPVYQYDSHASVKREAELREKVPFDPDGFSYDFTLPRSDPTPYGSGLGYSCCGAFTYDPAPLPRQGNYATTRPPGAISGHVFIPEPTCMLSYTYDSARSHSYGGTFKLAPQPLPAPDECDPPCIRFAKGEA